MDCQAARSFLAQHGIEVDMRDVTEVQVRDEMESRFGRVGTPAIVVGGRVFWGFQDNLSDIADLLGIGVRGGSS